MTDEEIKEYLKDKLSISIDRDFSGSYSSCEHITVSLNLDGETISEDFIDIDDNLT